MPDIFRIATGDAPASGTQDYTHADITNVTAALVFAFNSATDADDDNLMVQMGAWDDANNQWCLGIRTPDASTSGFFGCGSNPTDGYVIRGAPDGTNERNATAAATPSGNGIRLTWNSNSETMRVVVLLIQLESGGAQAGMDDKSATVTGTTTVTTTGITPNCVLFGHVAQPVSAVATAFSTSCVSWGVAIDNGSSLEEAYSLMRTQPISTISQVATRVSTTRVGAWTGSAGGELGAISCTAMASGSFEVTNDIGTTAHAFGYLALELADTPDLNVVTTPTSGAAWDPYTDTVKRDAVVGFVSSAVSADSEQSSGAGAAGMGVWMVDSKGTEEGAFGFSDDAVTPSDTSGRDSAAMIIQIAKGTPDFTASSPTIDSSGLSFDAANVSTATSAHQVVFLSLGRQDIVIPVPLGPWR